MALFNPPVAYVLPRVTSRSRGVERAHFKHYSPLPVGQSVLKENGVYVTVMTPAVDRTLAAEEYYAGGHVHEVSDEVAAALTEAGYGDCLS